MLNINAKAMKVVREIIEDADALGCKVIKMDCGATLIDMGINCEGSWKAGVLFTRACMGDMSTVTLGEFKLNEDYTFASVEVSTNKPLIACMASQIAGWKLGSGEFATIGSGPARAIAHVDSDWYFEMTDYKEENKEAVLCLQDVKYPTDEVALEVAKACNVKPEDTYLLISDSTCIVASIQVSGRMLEQTCHKMFEKGFDAGQIVMIRGTAPIAPIVKDEMKAMGRINDALIYGSSVEIWVDATDEDIERVMPGLVGKTSSPCYGQLFEQVFEEAGRDFFYVDHDVHSLGRVQIHNINTGKAFCAGEIHFEVLEKSFLN